MKRMYVVLLVAYKCILKKKNLSFHALSACSDDKDAQLSGVLLFPGRKFCQ